MEEAECQIELTKCIRQDPLGSWTICSAVCVKTEIERNGKRAEALSFIQIPILIDRRLTKT